MEGPWKRSDFRFPKSSGGEAEEGVYIRWTSRKRRGGPLKAPNLGGTKDAMALLHLKGARGFERGWYLPRDMSGWVGGGGGGGVWGGGWGGVLGGGGGGERARNAKLGGGFGGNKLTVETWKAVVRGGSLSSLISFRAQWRGAIRAPWSLKSLGGSVLGFNVEMTWQEALFSR